MGFFDRIINFFRIKDDERDKDSRDEIHGEIEELQEEIRELREELATRKEIEELREEIRELKEELERDFEDDVGVRRKIIKSIWYDPTQPHRAGSGIKVYSLTYEDNDEDRIDELINALSMGDGEVEQGLTKAPRMENLPDRGNTRFIGRVDWIQVTDWGYDD